MHANARLADVHHKQTDDECNSGYHFKIKKRETARFAHLLHVFHAGDARHHRTENHGRDDHFDQTDKTVAERLHLGANVWEEEAEEHAENNRADHLKVENLVDRCSFLAAHDAHIKFLKAAHAALRLFSTSDLKLRFSNGDALHVLFDFVLEQKITGLFTNSGYFCSFFPLAQAVFMRTFH